MTTQIDNLNDDCLLHIFNFFDPLSLVSIAQVCTRWEQVVRLSLKKITEVHLKSDKLCKSESHKTKNVTFINADEVKTALRLIGENLKSLVLGDCPNNTIHFSTQFQNFSYHITNRNFFIEDFISTVSQNCPNIEELHVGKVYIDMMDFYLKLLKSAKKLKKVVLPDKNLMLPNCTFDSVEDVTLRHRGESNLRNFELLFPNLNELTLQVEFKFCLILGPVLKRVKHIKSLTIVGEKKEYSFMSSNSMPIVSYISCLTKLENLRVFVNGEVLSVSFQPINKLINRCQNLRTVVIGTHVNMNTVSSFLKLPNLEKLVLSEATLYNYRPNEKLESHQCPKLTEFYLSFSGAKRLDVSSLVDVIKKMPALEYLEVDRLYNEQLFELISKVIPDRVEYNDVIIDIDTPDCRPYKTITIYKNGISNPSPKPLRWIVYIKEKVYDKVQQFVQSLKNCSVTEPSTPENTFGDMFFDYHQHDKKVYGHCTCVSQNRYTVPERSFDDESS